MEIIILTQIIIIIILLIMDTQWMNHCTLKSHIHYFIKILILMNAKNFNECFDNHRLFLILNIHIVCGNDDNEQ